MMKRYEQVKAVMVGTAMLATVPALAQNGLTLYEVVDTGIG